MRGLGLGLGLDVGSVVPGAGTKDGCVSYWDMADATDSTGRGNTLTEINSPTYNVSGGKPGAQTDLEEASDQWFTRADSADQSMDDTSFTVCAWAILESGGGFRRVLSKGNISTIGGFEYCLNYNNSNNYQFSIGNGTSAFTQSIVVTNVTTTWKFLVGRFDMGRMVSQFSVNAGSVSELAFTGAIPATASVFYIGSDTTGISRDWDGLLDSIGIWKKVLTNSQIQFLYNNGIGRSFSELL